MEPGFIEADKGVITSFIAVRRKDGGGSYL